MSKWKWYSPFVIQLIWIQTQFSVTIFSNKTKFKFSCIISIYRLSVPQYHNKVSIHWKVNLNKCDQKMKRTNSIMLIMALLAMFKIRSLQSQFKLWSLAFRLLFSISVLKNVLGIIFKFIPLNFKEFNDFHVKENFLLYHESIQPMSPSHIP